MSLSAAADPKLVSALEQQKVRRACHFTRLQNWAQIREVGGLLPVSELHRDHRPVAANDTQRLDHHTFHNCLTLEYPNLFLLEEYMSRIGGDWIVLLFAPEVVAVEGALFSPVNAATRGGACVEAGLKGFFSMFVNHNESDWGIRQAKHLPSAPTDNQAEALVPGLVSITHLKEVIVQNESVADELLRHDGFDDLPGVKITVDPAMFRNSTALWVRLGKDLDQLRHEIRAG